jgi:predicted transcriptional regulator
MAHSLPNVTEAEWSVLQVLWEQGPSTVRQLTDVLYPGGGASQYATVHKLLERLGGKDYVRRDRQGGSQVFQATVDRDQLIGSQLEALADRMCGGSLQPLLSNLIRVKRLTPGELRELLALVEELDKKTRPRRGRG